MNLFSSKGQEIRGKAANILLSDIFTYENLKISKIECSNINVFFLFIRILSYEQMAVEFLNIFLIIQEIFSKPSGFSDWNSPRNLVAEGFG